MKFRRSEFLRAALLAVTAASMASCARPAKLTVAAAANLTDAFGEVGRAFQSKTGVEVVFSYGSTAQLTQQIANGAPFDLFAAADTQHVDTLVSTGKLVPDSRAVFAQGQLALWIPHGDQSGIRQLADLASPKVRFIAVAQPELAPYGQATVEVLKGSGLWEAVMPKIVYGNSINVAREMAASGNADVAFTAYSLVLHEPGIVLKIDPHLHHAIDQALGIVASSSRIGEANQFRAFILGKEGRAILAKDGYVLP